MITRIEIDGFKTFQDFAVDLNPFQVIIGANGSGKSNLFEAIRLLALLANQEINQAFQKLRGEPHELFTILPDGTNRTRMRFAVEMLVPRKVSDKWGAKANITYPRLRYELEIAYAPLSMGIPVLHIVHEALNSIPPEEDRLRQRYGSGELDRWFGDPFEEKQEFISTDGQVSTNNTLTIHNDKEGHEDGGIRVALAFSRQTTIGRIDNCGYPHVLAAQQEMESWIMLEGRPEVLRLSSLLFEDETFIAGNAVPMRLARLEREEPSLFRSVSRDLSQLIPGISKVDVELDKLRNEFVVYVTMTDNRRLPARLLSDGTLRSLMLATIKNDPLYNGVLLLEEPENSIHPGELKRLVHLIRDMTTGFEDPDRRHEPFRQVIASTHSPEIVKALDIQGQELLFAEMVTRINPGQSSLRVTRMTPVSSGGSGKEKAYILSRIIEYLNNASAGETLSDLRELLRR